MNGKTVQTSSNLDEKIDKTLDMFKEMSVDDLEAMADAISKFYEENDIKVVPQATYEIWLVLPLIFYDKLAKMRGVNHNMRLISCKKSEVVE